MRIALLSWESLPAPAWTEAAIVAGETARALNAAGAEVHVFTARAPGQEAEAVLDGVRYYRCAHDPDPDPMEEAANLGRAMLDRLHRIEGKDRFRVVHGFEWPTAWVLGELRREQGRATVWSFLQPREDWRPPAWLVEQPGAEQRWRYHPAEFAGRIVAPSEPAQQVFAARWGLPQDRVEVVHPGIDPGWPGAPVNPAEVKAGYRFDAFDPLLLFIGHLTLEARPALVMDAMPQVLERHPNARLVLAGDGELAGPLVDRAQVLGIEGAVRLVGELPDRELARLCQSCDAVCLPQRSQSLLAPCLHAWAAGKPVIITRAHAAAAFVWPEVTGYLAEESAAGFAAAALWMFADFDRCRWIGGNGRKAVADAFGWPAIAARLLDCYRRAAADRGVAPAVR